VRGADVSRFVVESVSNGTEPFPGEHGLEGMLREAVGGGLLTATSDTTAAVAESDVAVVVVPLFVDAAGTPDFASLEAATQAIGEGLRPGALVSYETTLPVGTTRSRFGPALEKYSGLRAGEGFSLVFSPERVLTGRVFQDLRRYPKLIGGVDEGSANAARQFYEAVLDFDERPDLPMANGVWDLGTSEAAELAKLAETTYRDVNIGLANQFALFAEQNGIDIHQVIAASNSQPYSHIHRPGVAVGGHCIPVYPRLYLWNDPAATVVSAARAANEAMPEVAIRHLEGMLGGLEGATVAVLGATYRSGVKETAFSGVFPLVTGLSERGARPVVHDPLLSAAELVALGLQPYTLGEAAEAVVVHTDHAEYAEIGEADVPGVQAVVDGRNVTRPGPWGDVPRRVLGVG
jgi:nucleotide sugar dehydrogenase